MTKNNNKGFSLVELIVVIAIMAVLIGVLAPALIGNIEKSRESKDFSTLDSVFSAVKNAYGDEAGNKSAPSNQSTPTYWVQLDTIITNAKGKTPTAFESQVYEYIEDNDVQKSLSSGVCDGAKIWINIDDKGHITVLISKEKSVAGFDKAVDAKKTVDKNNKAKKFIVGYGATSTETETTTLAPVTP